MKREITFTKFLLVLVLQFHFHIYEPVCPSHCNDIPTANLPAIQHPCHLPGTEWYDTA